MFQILDGLIPYQKRLDRFIERECKAASGMSWRVAAPPYPNWLLFNGVSSYSGVFMVFRVDKRPLYAAALLVMTGAAADRMLEIADHVTSDYWAEKSPTETAQLLERYGACIKTGARLKESVDPLGGRRAFQISVEGVAENSSRGRFCAEDLAKALRHARSGERMSANDVKGVDYDD